MSGKGQGSSDKNKVKITGTASPPAGKQSRGRNLWAKASSPSSQAQSPRQSSESRKDQQDLRGESSHDTKRSGAKKEGTGDKGHPKSDTNRGSNQNDDEGDDWDDEDDEWDEDYGSESDNENDGGSTEKSSKRSSLHRQRSEESYYHPPTPTKDNVEALFERAGFSQSVSKNLTKKLFNVDDRQWTDDDLLDTFESPQALLQYLNENRDLSLSQAVERRIMNDGFWNVDAERRGSESSEERRAARQTALPTSRPVAKDSSETFARSSESFNNDIEEVHSFNQSFDDSSIGSPVKAVPPRPAGYASPRHERGGAKQSAEPSPSRAAPARSPSLVVEDFDDIDAEFI